MPVSKRKGKGTKWQGTKAATRTRKGQPKAGHVAPRRITDGFKPNHAARASTQADKLVTPALGPAVSDEDVTE